MCNKVQTLCCYTVAIWWRKVDNVHEVVFLSSQVAITANNIRRLQLFEDDQPDCTLLALHPPDDPTQGLEWKTLLLALIRHTHKSHRLTPSARPSSAGFIPAWQVVVRGWCPTYIQNIQKWFDVGNCFFIPLLVCHLCRNTLISRPGLLHSTVHCGKTYNYLWLIIWSICRDKGKHTAHLKVKIGFVQCLDERATLDLLQTAHFPQVHGHPSTRQTVFVRFSWEKVFLSDLEKTHAILPMQEVLGSTPRWTLRTQAW